MNFKNTILISLLFPSLLFAQQKNQDGTLLVYSVGLGGNTSRIGAIINKK